MPIKCCKDCVPPHKDSQDVMLSVSSTKQRKLNGKRKKPKLVKTRPTQSTQVTLKC